MKNLKKVLSFTLLVSVLLIYSCSKEEDAPQPQPTQQSNNNGGTNNFTRFTIATVKVVNMPSNNTSGNSWDVLNGADVFYTFSDINFTIFYTSATYFPNVSSLPLNFILTPNYMFSNITSTMYVTLWDDDFNDIPSNADDLIGSVDFILVITHLLIQQL